MKYKIKVNCWSEPKRFEMLRESEQLKQPHPPIEFLEKIFAESLKQKIDDEKEIDDFLIEMIK